MITIHVTVISFLTKTKVTNEKLAAILKIVTTTIFVLGKLSALCLSFYLTFRRFHNFNIGRQIHDNLHESQQSSDRPIEFSSDAKKNSTINGKKYVISVNSF